MTTAWVLLGVAVLLILANGLFVAAEFSLVTVERGAVERAAGGGDRRAGRVLAALRTLSFELSGAQLGITVTSLLVGMLANPAVARLLGPPLTAAGLPGGAVHPVAVVLGLLLATVLQMVVGELVPKNWAISRPLQVARAVAGPQRVFSTVCRPLIVLLNGLANAIVRALGMEPADELASARSAEELVALARHSASEGALEEDTADLFVRTLGLGELTAESVMTPRVDVSALHESATAADVLNLTRATGLSRFPVYRDGIDEVIGVVTLKDALAVPVDRRPAVLVDALAAPPLLVPETLPAERLLELLRRAQPMAVVVDEYGGTAGVATLEDIIEEMVGEVLDEHDAAERAELRPVEPVGGREAWEADGRCRVDQLGSIGLHAPPGPYETVAGLVADLLGRLPEPGEYCELPGWRLTVQAVDRHRTESVLLVRAADAAGAPAGRERER
ncbi:HlyC/CorC family transporter [Streptacidiphilus sp. PB12-B1b]|uniref:hemolysin family protein n=1 Tax=Streptacidiphilus sp. PB12-B1b TaxID=2705012 RepID=UPI0015FB46B8|nr:hemolysin family protein [Streptacidiphilus sp. PB12-B1b]QMU76110.1 HlyC/CorC family transporter [Streptacidiphilus sp. PB12-B1b]